MNDSNTPAPVTARLEALTPGARVRGVLATSVTVVGTTWHGTNALR